MLVAKTLGSSPLATHRPLQILTSSSVVWSLHALADKPHSSFLSSSTPSSYSDCINPDMVDAIYPPIVHAICETCASICQTCSVQTVFPPQPTRLSFVCDWTPLLTACHRMLSLASSSNSYCSFVLPRGRRQHDPFGLTHRRAPFIDYPALGLFRIRTTA